MHGSTFEPHLQTASTSHHAAASVASAVIALFNLVYIFGFCFVSLTYAATYISRRKDLVISSRAVDVLLWELLIVSITTFAIGMCLEQIIDAFLVEYGFYFDYVPLEAR